MSESCGGIVEWGWGVYTFGIWIAASRELHTPTDCQLLLKRFHCRQAPPLVGLENPESPLLNNPFFRQVEGLSTFGVGVVWDWH